MDPRTAEQVDFIVEAPLGFALQADLLMRLLTRETVGEIMARLPSYFREQFVAFARDVYRPEGDRLVVAGTALPPASLDAIRCWLRQLDAGGAPQRGIPARRFDDPTWAALWAEATVAYGRLRADEASWADEREERLTWDAAYSDSLEDDAYAEAG
jgi:hypothetical protein